jgi:prepilin-type N-terminal cleavage/methylation domain-containing protein
MSLLRSAARFRQGDQDGLTMVEMMVILAVIALLALAAYPQLSNVLQVMVSKGASEQVAGAIRQARQYAITEGANRCISFGATPVTIYRIRELNCSQGPLRDQGEIGNGAAVVNPNNLSIMFDPVGRISPATVDPVTVTVDTQPPSCASVIIVTPFGGVKVSKC